MLKLALLHLLAGSFFLVASAKPQQDPVVSDKLTPATNSSEPLSNIQLSGTQAPDIQVDSSPEKELPKQPPATSEGSNEAPLSPTNENSTYYYYYFADNESASGTSNNKTEESNVGNGIREDDLVQNPADKELENNNIANGTSSNGTEAVSPKEVADPLSVSLNSPIQVKLNSWLNLEEKPTLAPSIPALAPKKYYYSAKKIPNAGNIPENLQPTAINVKRPENTFLANSQWNELRINEFEEALKLHSLLSILGFIPSRPDASLVSVSSGVSNFHIMNYNEDQKLQAIKELLQSEEDPKEFNNEVQTYYR